MSVNHYELKSFIKEKEELLEKQYPIDAMYSSRSTLWRNGLCDGIVSEEDCKKARDYYGTMWNYVGD